MRTTSTNPAIRQFGSGRLGPVDAGRRCWGGGIDMRSSFSHLVVRTTTRRPSAYLSCVLGTLRVMSRTPRCARPGCGAAADATLSYDYASRTVWLDPTDR